MIILNHMFKGISGVVPFLESARSRTRRVFVETYTRGASVTLTAMAMVDGACMWWSCDVSTTPETLDDITTQIGDHVSRMEMNRVEGRTWPNPDMGVE
jgi:hypothetical protein